MEKINVLELVDNLEIGGAENVVKMLAEGFDKEKFNIIVCSISIGGFYVNELRKKGIKVYVLNKKHGIDFSIISKIRKVIRKEKIDIIHTHLWTADLWGRFAAILERKKVISTAHNVEIWKKKHHKLIDRLLAPFTYKIVAVSNEVKNFYINKIGIDKRKLLTIHNGIDIKYIKPNKSKDEMLKKLGIKGQVVGIVGRLHPQKDHKNFLKAVRLVLKEIPNTNFLIVGNGLLRKELEDYVRKLKIDDNVKFLGLRKDIYNIFNIMDVNVLSSIHEGHPIVLLEAMFLKIPSVVTRVGGNPELIEDGRNGFVVPSRDSEALAKSIVKLLKNKNLREKFGEGSRIKIEKNFSSDKMIEKYEMLFNHIKT